jgi:hypothetical protein
VRQQHVKRPVGERVQFIEFRKLDRHVERLNLG